MPLKKGDFVQVQYTGRLKENNHVFDTTEETVAKTHELEPKAKYEPVIICLGEGQILQGIDDGLIGKEIGKHTVELTPENAFGRKDAKLIQLVPMRKFKEENINPVQGLQVQMDNAIGTIRRAGGGRVLVDFNHPLAGQDLSYEITVEKLITDKKEQALSLCKSMFGTDGEVKVEEKKIIVTLKESLPPEISKEIAKKWAEVLKVDTVEFVSKKEEKKPTQTQPSE